jgi:hypothetical protein
MGMHAGNRRMCAIAQTAHTDSITTAMLINMLLHFHYVPLFCRIL